MNGLPMTPASHWFWLPQTGIATFEGIRNIAGPQWRTVTIVAKDLPHAGTALWTVMASRPPSLMRVFRVGLQRFQIDATRSQQRRFLTGLKGDPLGFGDTSVSYIHPHAYVAAELSSQKRSSSTTLSTTLGLRSSSATARCHRPTTSASWSVH